MALVTNAAPSSPMRMRQIVALFGAGVACLLAGVVVLVWLDLKLTEVAAIEGGSATSGIAAGAALVASIVALALTIIEALLLAYVLHCWTLRRMSVVAAVSIGSSLIATVVAAVLIVDIGGIPPLLTMHRQIKRACKQATTMMWTRHHEGAERSR